MTEFKIGDKVRINNVYASNWPSLDGSEKAMRGHEGTVVASGDDYIEVAPNNPVVGGWDYPNLLLPEELDKL